MQLNTLGLRDSTVQTNQNPISREQELELKMKNMQEIFDKKCAELNEVIKAQNTVISIFRKKIEKLEGENPKLNQIDSVAKEIKAEISEKVEPTKIAPTKEITVYQDIPSMFFKNIKQDEFKAAVKKDFPNAQIRFKDNQLCITDANAILIRQTYDVRMFLAENFSSTRCYISDSFRYALTHDHDLKVAFKAIEKDTETQIKGLSGSPWKTLCTAKHSDTIIRLMIGDFSTSTADLIVCGYDPKDKKAYGDASAVVNRLSKLSLSIVSKELTDANPGDVLESTVKMGSKSILNCILPPDGSDEELKILVGKIIHLAIEASKKNPSIESIAISPLSGNEFNTRNLTLVTQYIKYFLSKYTNHRIREIHLISHSLATCEAWAGIMAREFDAKLRVIDKSNETLHFNQRIENPTDEKWYFQIENTDTWAEFAEPIQNKIQFYKQNMKGKPFKFDVGLNESLIHFDSSSSAFTCSHPPKDKIIVWQPHLDNYPKGGNLFVIDIVGKNAYIAKEKLDILRKTFVM